MNKLVSGIYFIIHKESNKYYVGSSTNVKRRIRNHKRLLNKNQHHNSPLQNAWDKYGKDAFTVKEVLLPINVIRSVEQSIINNNDKKYNVCDIVGQPKSVFDNTKHDFYHLKHGHRFSSSYELEDEFDLPRCRLRTLLTTEAKSYKGWFLGKSKEDLEKLKEETHMLKSKARRNKEVFTFYHKEHGKHICTARELINKFNLTQGVISSLTTGRQQVANGWYLTDDKQEILQIDATKYRTRYEFVTNGKEVRFTNIEELGKEVKYAGAISKMFRGLTKTSYGWNKVVVTIDGVPYPNYN